MEAKQGRDGAGGVWVGKRTTAGKKLVPGKERKIKRERGKRRSFSRGYLTLASLLACRNPVAIREHSRTLACHQSNGMSSNDVVWSLTRTSKQSLTRRHARAHRHRPRAASNQRPLRASTNDRNLTYFILLLLMHRRMCSVPAQRRSNEFLNMASQAASTSKCAEMSEIGKISGIRLISNHREA